VDLSVGAVVVLAAGGGIGTLVLLRARAALNGHTLPALVANEQAHWGCLCRVVSVGSFLDERRAPRGHGPAGTLLFRHDLLMRRPERSEWSSGRDWRTSELRLVKGRYRRDVSGLRVLIMTLQTPEGEVSFGIHHEAGDRPPLLSGIPPRRRRSAIHLSSPG
jgi:hypothetical protein